MDGAPFGRYRLVELLGRGGMGEVWKAYDTATQRVVAVKVLPAQLAADPVFEERFRHEAFAAAGLTNPHVVPIHNFGEIEGRLYVDMRLIEGRDLEHVLADGPMAPARAVKIIEQIASALHAAHRIGLVHRDVKPSNILVAEDDFSYLIDFGIARAAGETKLTATGNVVGTWPYMAPERFTAGQSDSRADIYALTCVLYECLTSARPFPGDSVEQQIASHLTTPPPRPSIKRPDVTSELDAVIAAGMAKDPDDRYGTTVELARAASRAVANAADTTLPVRPHPLPTAAGPAPSAPTDQVGQAWAPTQARAAEQENEQRAWAATQAAPPLDAEQAFAPTQARPAEQIEQDETQREPDEDGSWPWWRRASIVVPLAIVLIIAAAATILAVLAGGGDGNGNEKRPVARPPDAPLDGTFAVEFGPPTKPNGEPYSNIQGGNETWVIKSACPAQQCVAAATKVGGSHTTTSTLVLDEIDGRWEAVSAKQTTCQGEPVELWEAFTLQPQPDGTLKGQLVVRSTNGTCASNQPVKFTRTGDPQPGAALADPAAQPPRVVSPAEALHGRYQETDTYVDGNRSAEASFDIQTYCLRTGQRCLSYWLNPNDAKILAFEQNQFVLTNTSADSQCKNGGTAHREISLQYPLPQPPQDPITLLTGRGHYTVTGGCPFNSDFDSRVQRTGD
ncbi:serine/threonine-protein kinase [Mycobacterium sp. E740]|uniref:serine/threonine-protein kinase n=1 Tax=Mycobacterium sp. E740 TaxID=1834149 RepID=UPI0007FE4991|nr:serine/threonine-protein kinase [Mycobacterium sp. E740]OBI81966.1 serine/threonine protein kinase [Mycobacterium sp. E740]